MTRIIHSNTGLNKSWVLFAEKFRAIRIGKGKTQYPKETMGQAVFPDSVMALPDRAATSHVRLSKLTWKWIKYKIQFLSHSSHISSARQPHVVSGFHLRQCKYRVFPSSQKALLDSAALGQSSVSFWVFYLHFPFLFVLLEFWFFSKAIQIMDKNFSSKLVVMIYLLFKGASKSAQWITVNSFHGGSYKPEPDNTGRAGELTALGRLKVVPHTCFWTAHHICIPPFIYPSGFHKRQ